MSPITQRMAIEINKINQQISPFKLRSIYSIVPNQEPNFSAKPIIYNTKNIGDYTIVGGFERRRVTNSRMPFFSCFVKQFPPMPIQPPYAVCAIEKEITFLPEVDNDNYTLIDSKGNEVRSIRTSYVPPFKDYYF